MSRRRTLTEEMVFMRTKSNRMDLIRNLNLWGNDLHELGVLRQMPNLEVLSLSVNRIDSIAEIRHCSKLIELYLRKNEICDLAEVQHLTGLKHLRVLWLSDNPCATLPGYRLYVLRHLPNLSKLDAQDVSDEERRRASMADLEQMQTCVEPSPSVSREVPAAPDLASTGSGSPVTRGAGIDAYDTPPSVDYEPPRPQRRGGGGQAWDDEEFRTDFGMDMGPGAAPVYGGSPRSLGLPLAGATAAVNGQRTGLSGPPRSAWPPQEADMHGRQVQAQQRRFRAGAGDFPPSRDRASTWQQGVADEDYYGRPPDLGYAVGDSITSGDAARADNILCAVLALIKELDGQGLELVRRAIEQRQMEL